MSLVFAEEQNCEYKTRYLNFNKPEHILKLVHCLHFQVLFLVCAVLIGPSAKLIISVDQTRPSYLLIFYYVTVCRVVVPVNHHVPA